MKGPIIVADDGSDHAARAVELACELAVKFGSKLIALHAVEPDKLPDDLLGMAEMEHLVPSSGRVRGDSWGVASLQHGLDKSEARRIAAEALGRQVLSRAEASARGAGVSDISTVLAFGDPASEILEQQKTTRAGMLVLGTRGLGRLRGLLIGSVSHKVTSLAPCTCVLAR